MKLNQNQTPFLDALIKYVNEKISPFDVPGHHLGNAENKFKDFLGGKAFKSDVNAPIGLDSLPHPTGVIKQAQELMADFTGADHSFFLVNGTTSGIIAMIMSVCKAKDKIILPRNVHKSIISALVLSGSIPIYVMPKIDRQLEIANQPTVDDYKRAILRYPSAKAVLVINPTYFGAIADLKEITKFAHAHNVAVLVDEAHGAHYYFSKNGPISAMEADADLASVSFHKTGGSLTQSSVLLLKGERVNPVEVQKSLNIINTTSPSNLLIASIDAARHFAATKGQETMDVVLELSKYAREQIAKIKGFIPRGREHFLQKGCFDYDETKLVIELDHLDLSGFDLYYLLKEKYQIQVELAETYVILGILAIGTKKEHLRHLFSALKEISHQHYNRNIIYPRHSFSVSFPFLLVRPRSAFYAPSKRISILEAANQISKESIMIYPPGIPLIIPGEIFTSDLIERIKTYKETGITMLSDYSDGTVNVIDKENWKRFSSYQKAYLDYSSKRITTPHNDGYMMPFEGDEHQATFILLPFRKDTWRLGAKPARDAYKEVVRAIVKFEPVVVGIHPNIYDAVAGEFSNIENVSVIKVKYNDAWARDNAPIFVKKSWKLRTVDFRFNAWRGDEGGLYTNYYDDDKLASHVSKKMHLDSYYIDDFVLEGGSIHVDGKGTCLVTEACLLSKGRNPHMSKQEIEETLKTNLGVSKVIWIKNGIYQDETSEHVDNMACFVRPGVVALAWTTDRSDPQYKYSHDAYKVLKNETDAEGNPLEIVKIKLPKPMYMNKEEAKGIRGSRSNAKKREPNMRLAASYINYYQGKNFVILPAFGVAEDAVAFEQFKGLYPDKQIIQINTREILLGGGNIHCITMQIPEGRKGELLL
ncbi:MAG: agmatine deiminase [Erysipelotrichia bacterium]|jgi:lysine decarboxylase|nr:agmatine deiminase [Bacilli bacterium]MDD4005600.1 agmatine deiminase [Bacilli bacterium]NMV82127.1 agmatine deiminase [Erysipelotrichia bacterium]